MHLPADVFQTVVVSTPLVSIDLVVENGCGEILLGLRNNRPAQGCWFVPGGRILKHESLDAAFTRLVRDELGVKASRTSACFLGVYEHFYSDSVFGEAPDPYYVVLIYHLPHVLDLSSLPSAQHHDYRWWPQVEMAASDRVHSNSRVYLTAMEEIAHRARAREQQKGAEW